MSVLDSRAQPGCWLVSADFSAIEAVLTGWYSNDPDYMRLARLGIHSYLVSHKVGGPADLSWSDRDLGAYLSDIKKRDHDTSVYKSLKRTVHLSADGGSPFQMNKVDPDLFPTIAVAAELHKFYQTLCPKQVEWQNQTRLRADKQGYLGGMDHPYRFKHWFWDVTGWDPSKKQGSAFC